MNSKHFSMQNETPEPQRQKSELKIDMKKLKRSAVKIKRRLLSRHLWAVRASLVVVFLAALFAILLLVKALLVASGVSNYLSLANSFIFTPPGTVKTYQGRTNILLLGKAGDGVKNPILTDTIILASIGPKDVTMISFPRDIWVPELKDKLNSAYYWGNQNQEGGGIVLAKSVVEQIAGVPVHYAMALDFDGFVDVIDIVGGVDINVERTFTDTRYPIKGKEDDTCGGDPTYACRYETVHFEKGLQHMDGVTALKYARSRHSEDLEEGNDLARAARQQKVIAAIEAKLMTKQVYTSPNKLLSLYKTFWKITETDMSKNQVAYVARKIYNVKGNINSHVLPEDFLDNPPYIPEYNNLYVFLPKGGDWSKVQAWVEGLLGGS